MTAKKKTINSKNTKTKKTTVKYPAKLLKPVGDFLQDKLKMLEKRKREVEEEDPFADPGRISNNASPDTDAAEQFGHARTAAIKDQLDRKIIQTRKALSRIRVGTYGVCEVCGKMIDTDRLMIYPEATLCAKDSARQEKKNR